MLKKKHGDSDGLRMKHKQCETQRKTVTWL